MSQTDDLLPGMASFCPQRFKLRFKPV